MLSPVSVVSMIFDYPLNIWVIGTNQRYTHENGHTHTHTHIYIYKYASYSDSGLIFLCPISIY